MNSLKIRSILAALLLTSVSVPVLAVATDPAPQAQVPQAMSAYDVAIYQRDAATKQLQDAQLRLALAQQEIAQLTAKVEDLQKKLDAETKPSTPQKK